MNQREIAAEVPVLMDEITERLATLKRGDSDRVRGRELLGYAGISIGTAHGQLTRALAVLNSGDSDEPTISEDGSKVRIRVSG